MSTFTDDLFNFHFHSLGSVDTQKSRSHSSKFPHVKCMLTCKKWQRRGEERRRVLEWQSKESQASVSSRASIDMRSSMEENIMRSHSELVHGGTSGHVTFFSSFLHVI